MRLKSELLFVAALVFVVGCKSSQNREATAASSPSPALSSAATSPETSAPPGGVKPKTDACALLTTADIEAVQKETVKDTKLTGSSQRGFNVSQCFFTLPTFNNSISLQVTQRGEGSGSRDPREFWRETFHRESESERESERERDKRNKKEERGREEEEEDRSPPQKVSGVGDEAYWVGDRIGGALYVLKGDSYVRVSIGGGGSQADKIQKLK
ncbi:MAG TPA: hypothetical protein VF251_11820, partial [Pyrinomonadaceae bacterium]